MNTPPPCDRCRHLYADCLSEDDPDYEAECFVGGVIGDVNCPMFTVDPTIKKEEKNEVK